MSFLPEPLQIPSFRAFWLARLATTIAQMAMVIVIGWQVYDIARSHDAIREAAFQLGLIGLVQFVPLFLLTPISGWAADRLDRRHIARAVILLEMVCALVLFVATWRGFIGLPILFGVAALLGVARAFAGPAFGALRRTSCRATSCRARSRSARPRGRRARSRPGARRHPL